MVFEPENKIVYFTTVNVVDYFETLLYRDETMSLVFLDEELRKELVLFPMKKFLPFFEEFKMQVQRLVESIEWTKHTNGNRKRLKARHEGINDSVPALVLNIDDLEIGFLVCCVPLAFGVVTFFCEALRPWIINLADDARNLLTFLYVIQAVTKLKDLANKM